MIIEYQHLADNCLNSIADYPNISIELIILKIPEHMTAYQHLAGNLRTPELLTENAPRQVLAEYQVALAAEHAAGSGQVTLHPAP